MTSANFLIVPEEIAYCAKLELGARLFYGELRSFCSKSGYCWASNAYFANKYCVSEKTITRWIQSLIKLNFIESICEKIKEKWTRKLMIKKEINLDKNVQGGVDKNVHIIGQEEEDISYIKERLKKKEVRDSSPSEHKKENLKKDNPERLAKKESPKFSPSVKKEILQKKDYLKMSENQKQSLYVQELKTPTMLDPPPELYRSDEDLLHYLELPETFCYATLETPQSEEHTIKFTYTIPLARKLLKQNYGIVYIKDALSRIERMGTIVRGGNLIALACGIMKQIKKEILDGINQVPNPGNNYRRQAGCKA